MSIEPRELAFAGVAFVLLVTGVVMVVAGWGSAGPLLTIGVGTVQLSALGSVATYFAGKRANLDDAFEAGYQAGFYRGQRIKPKVVRLPSGRTTVPPVHVPEMDNARA